jgi:hypothetical protein
MASHETPLPLDLQAIVASLAGRLIPQIEEMNQQRILLDLQIAVRRYVWALPLFLRIGFRLGLRIFEWTPVFFGFGLIRFSKMSTERQAHYVADWAESGLFFRREFFKMLKALMNMILCSHPLIWQYLDYEPWAHIHEKIALRKQLLNEEIRHES